MQKDKQKVTVSELILNKFNSSKRWQLFFYIMRIVTFLLIVVLIFIMVKEIRAVKLLNYDPCKICMNKTGAMCFLPPKL